MERLKKRLRNLAAILLIAGIFAHALGGGSSLGHDEKWMEAHSLSRVGPFRMDAGDSSDPSVTYRMSPETYAALTPSGIVCRSFTDGGKTFDVVLVGSQAKDSFHDPRICFGAQGWNLDEESELDLPTDRGVIPVSIAKISSDGVVRWAAYTYRDDHGFFSSTNRFKFDLFTYSLVHSKPGEGVFYRFIGTSSGVARDDLVQFIQRYLNDSGKFSGGYF